MARSPLQVLIHEVGKFGVVGAICYAIDFAVSNLCHTLLGMGPLSAKTVSTVIAATCAYVGNRQWSFNHRARTGIRREYTLFVILNAIGLVIALACLGFAKYVLHLEGVLAFNLFGNVLGTGLGTIFRFWTYKKYVFLHPDHPKVAVLPVKDQRIPEPAAQA
ncbi:polysaccharide synthesis protein GtrA [Parafrankia colletiae]|uniref:Polysaccharide synthesis protein GtrA n=1 Tax=Parafrankia colletiae TaxID=573497 RepID=A0A1S1QGL0_9ACTN|nr:GtrA family protein [Parafrankia colletiae]MCK9902714.1 GtrA family protein [Frankia sp. Cpl3]OHV32385.1 polysaccharide synthesis protein GtrA [Parafrankia colletiae]